MDQASARTFIYTHGRLLERRLYEFHFDGGSPADVVRALEAYRNADGGYGQALEPDCRTPHSQPEALRWALQVAAEVDTLDSAMAERAADWLQSVANADGGVPFCLPSVEGYPRAPWWQPAPQSDMNPTGRLVAALAPLVPDHPWVVRARDWCAGQLATMDVANQYWVHAALELLLACPELPEAETWRERIGARLAAGDVVAVDPQAEVARPDAHTPLDFAPTPDHPLAALFGAATLRGFVDRQSARQADDGGLPIGWPAPGSTAQSEWRAIATLEALQREAAYGGGSSS